MAPQIRSNASVRLLRSRLRTALNDILSIPIKALPKVVGHSLLMLREVEEWIAFVLMRGRKQGPAGPAFAGGAGEFARIFLRRRFGLRRQSEAATALSLPSGVALPLPKEA